DWLQEQTEEIIQQWMPYITGDSDEFTILIPAADRLDALGRVLTEELQEGNSYTLLFDDVIGPLADDQLGENGRLPFGVSIPAESAVASAQQVFSAQWLQGHVDNVTGQLVPYLSGETDSFAITFPIADRIQVAVPAAKSLLVDSNVYNLLSNPEVEQEVVKVLEGLGRLPCGIVVTGGQVVLLIGEVVDPQWIQLRTENALDQISLYLTSPGADTILAIPLSDRIKAALARNDAPVKLFLRDIDAYDKVYRNCLVREIGNLVATAAGGGASTPEAPVFSLDISETMSIAITNQELQQALTDVLDAVGPEWIQEQVEGTIDAALPYYIGEADHFAADLSLEEVRTEVGFVFGDLVEQKLSAAYEALPPCSVQEALSLSQAGLAGVVPSCRPRAYSVEEVQQALGVPGPALSRELLETFCGCDLSYALDGVTLQTILDTVGIDLGAMVAENLGPLLPSALTFCDTVTYQQRCDIGLLDSQSPDQQETLDDILDVTRNGFTYTEADLREQLTDEDENIDRVLDWTRNGFSYTDADLRDDLGTDGTERLDDLLRWTSVGYTEADLQDLITNDGDNPEDFEEFDRVRGRIGLGRSLSFLPYVVLALVLAAIGFLGGRSWPGRIGWAAVVLGIASLLVYAAFGPVYDNVVGTFLDNQFDEVRADQVRDGAGVFEVVMVDKFLTIGRTFVDDFVSGIASRALVLLIVALAGLGVVTFWPMIFRPSQPAVALADGTPAEAPPAWGAANEPTVEVVPEEPPYENTPDGPLLEESAPDELTSGEPDEPLPEESSDTPQEGR
ncbi:MAG: hypothetical protein O6920_03235, partial [Chloroflexi bacterium]|nr:hypothetical protein [Chloroflexota bacterium]